MGGTEGGCGGGREDERRGRMRMRKAEESVVVLYESRSEGNGTIWGRRYNRVP